MTSQEAVIIAGNPDPLPYQERHSPKPTAIGQPPGPSPLLGQPNSRRQPPTPPTIVDGCTDLLALLDPRRRRGMIAWLSVRYYDGYRPCRAEIADLVAVELGTLTYDESRARRRARERGDDRVTDITPYIRDRHWPDHTLDHPPKGHSR